MLFASTAGTINRILFPNYLDYLVHASRPEAAEMREQMMMTNTLDHPFQIGMVAAVDPTNTTESKFIRCLKTELPPLEKKVN